MDRVWKVEERELEGVCFSVSSFFFLWLIDKFL